ncbi:glycosyltransferase family 9 protein [Leptotrichia trevisanii]|uniref:glycosyltransferase family 9 protein n=1 Tax=Leptotrichia trevisanii TaxID=109328 RepID=UPI0026EA440B|nr:glycosyltransferase family 9 protein [Leptotrichia trevisanii]
MKKINWKFYRPYRDRLVDKKNEMLSRIFDKNKKNINLEPIKINRILFLRTDGKIGDFIISSFIFREIKKHYPNIKIEVVADKSLENLLKLSKNIDKYYIFDRKKMHEWRNIVKILRKNKYDALLDSTEGLKYKQVYLLNRVNATVNVGYNKDDYKIYNKNIKQNNTLKMTEIYKQMMKSINIEIKDTKYDVPVSKESEKNVEMFLKENNVKEKIIALNFFGASRSRKINEENALIIIRRLSEMYKNYKIIILDSPNDRETIYNILAKADNKNVLFFEKSKTILDSISIIKKSDLVVSLDTSILHIAEGLNKKVMAFYGPKINKNKWRIKEENNILIDYPENRINDVDFEKMFDKLCSQTGLPVT